MPVVVQSRALAGSSAVPMESDVAPLTTDADGRFSVSLPIRFNAALRVLFAGAAGLSATVSEPLNLNVAPALTLTAAAATAVAGVP